MTRQLTAGLPASINVSMIDDFGIAVEASAVTWKLFSDAGVELAAGTATGFTADDVVAVVALSGGNTSITGTMAAREIVLYCTTAAGAVEVREVVLFVSSAPLAVSVNSYQTMTEAAMTCASFANLIGWDGATNVQRVAAMIEAHRRILRVQLQLPSSTLTESSQLWPRRRVNLSRLTAMEFASLPVSFRDAVKRAQVAEANQLLAGDPIGDRRREGIISETVGESSMFLSSKPYLNLPISKPAYEELKPYVVFIVAIARA